MTETNDTEQRWQIDKRIPLALILTVSVQTVAVGIWIGGINSRVSTLESVSSRYIESGDKLIRLDEKMNSVQQQQGEIKEELRRLAVRGGVK